MITRTPLRVSLFGGGTDYPEYYNRMPGSVVGLTINKYIYIAALELNAHQQYNYRLSYSALETVDQVGDIQHPVVREVLRHFGLDQRLDISVMSDLPASGSGLGSSSAFTVGFLNLVFALKQERTSKIDLARHAIFVERELLKENVGVQDQLHAAFGGVNRFDFEGKHIRITPAQIPAATLDLLCESMVLIHTGISRHASAIVLDQVTRTRDKSIDGDLGELYGLVGQCVDLLEAGGDDMLSMLGRMLSESWKIKRGLAARVSSDEIDELYGKIISGGACGAKLCGAGGGGYFLALAPPDMQARLRLAVSPHAVIPISVDSHGSSLVFPNR